jgi:predicted NBD/HSP70 family sugar kinase
MTNALEPGNTLEQIIEDLKFYADMKLTVKAIRLGRSAWDDLRNGDVRLVIEPGHFVADSFPKLFGIPVITLHHGNPWARSYVFDEISFKDLLDSVFPPLAEKVRDDFANPMNFTK